MTTPDVLSIGAITYRAGAPLPIATVIQWGSAAAIGAVALFAWLRRPAPVAVVVTAVASVLVSPILWPHYAVLILLPVALLLERRQWWAAALPLLGWIPVDAIYQVILWVALVAPVSFGRSPMARPAPLSPAGASA
jgi:hypothetical protein